MTDGSPVGTETLTDQSTGTNSPKYVAVKHFFRYIRPNSIRVNATVSGATALTASAFWQVTNGTMTLVIINASNSPVQTVINSPPKPAGIASWQTFTSGNGSYWQFSTNPVSNGSVSIIIPAYGVVTLYGVAPPLLSAAMATNGLLSFFWPPTAGGYLLQSTTNLSSTSTWSPVGSSQLSSNGLVNGLISETVMPNAESTFYRLKSP
jgi:hypothetical protein